MKKSEIKNGVSACMIVRDEQENLGRCLESIKNFVDEIIIVDTGSVDRTVEIAEGYGARIYHHPWEDNFSLHRNQSLSYATYSWVFVIDADEEFFHDSKLKAWLLNRPAEDVSVALALHDIREGVKVMDYNTARFFRHGAVSYQSMVHNEPVFEGKRAAFCPGMYIKHYGYDLSPEKKQAKFERTVGLLNKRLEKQPDDYLALFYLNQMYAGAGRYEEAVGFGEDYFSHRDILGESRFNRAIYFTMIRSYTYLKNLEKAGEWLDIALKELPDDLDIALALTEFGLNTRNPELLTMGARNYLRLYAKFQTDPSAGDNRFIHSNNPETHAFCAFQLTTYQLTDGFATLQVLSKSLANCNEEYSKGLLEMLQKSLGPYGINVRQAVSKSPVKNNIVPMPMKGKQIKNKRVKKKRRK